MKIFDDQAIAWISFFDVILGCGSTAGSKSKMTPSPAPGDQILFQFKKYRLNHLPPNHFDLMISRCFC